MRKAPLLLLILLLLITLSSCRRDAAFHDALLRAEALMETDPHAARALLDSIASPKSSPKGEDFKSPLLQEGRGEAAYYALLKTQADYKCHVRLTSDSLPLIATNYYGTNRKSQHAALAQYYLGCAYSDMRRDLDAIDALLRATTLFPDTTNKYYANSLFELGLLYLNHHMNEKAYKVFEQYRLTNSCQADSVLIGYVNYYMGQAAAYEGNDMLADSLYKCVLMNTKNTDGIRYDSYFQLAKIYFYHWHETQKAMTYNDKYIAFYAGKRSITAAQSLKADILLELNELELADKYFKEVLRNSKDIYTLCSTYKGLANVSSLLNTSDSTRFYINQYTILLDSIYSINKQMEIAEIQDKHIVEVHDQQLKARHARFMFWMGILAVALLSGTAITFLLIDRKRKKRYLQAQEELRQANVEVLRAQVDEQPADLDALYQKKLAACQKLFRRTPSARLLLVPPTSLTAAQRQTLMDDLTRSFVDIMLDVKNTSNAVNDQELMYCILSSLQCSTAQMAELLNTTESTLRSRKARLKEKMPDNLHALFLS